jgi:hypothetical protein
LPSGERWGSETDRIFARSSKVNDRLCADAAAGAMNKTVRMAAKVRGLGMDRSSPGFQATGYGLRKTTDYRRLATGEQN